jgi:hypothetical protein
MTSLPEPPPSKGMKLIAAYRAARLSERPLLRTTLHQTHVALRQSREQTLRSAEPIQPPPAPPEIVHEQQERIEDCAEGGSIFAGLMTAATAEIIQITVDETAHHTEEAKTAPMEAAETPPDAANQVPSSDQISSEPPVYDPPLAEIGFGPGMLIRLSQLGFHTTRDLAGADVNALRAGLGDISRLVNVETWVNNARHHMKG